MANHNLVSTRLDRQRLSRPAFSNPQEVVSWLGAVQSQEYPSAKWSIGMRMRSTSDVAIDRAFDAGEILRTHVMRPTWHFVAPRDIRWLLELTAQRVNASNAYHYRRVGLDQETFARSSAAIENALRDGRYLTREELGKVLEASGISIAAQDGAVSGLRLGYILHRLELDALICSGPRRGKQHTYALLAERAPQAHSLPRDEALAELVCRYFTGHGPARLRDFCWWSGQTQTAAKAGIEMAGSKLEQEEIDGQVYWFCSRGDPQIALPPEQAAFLLPTYDEFLVGYADFDKSRTSEVGDRARLTFNAIFLVNGQAAGTWKRTLKKSVVEITLAPFAPLPSEAEAQLITAAWRYADFLELSLEYRFLAPGQ